MNNVNIIGRITKDIELSVLDGGHKVTRFTLAIDNGKDANGNKRDASFIPCQAWNRTAEVLNQYCAKGSQIGIAGRIDTSKYEKDGRQIYNTYVVVDRMELLGAKPNQDQAHNDTAPVADIDINSDDLPF